MALAQPTALPGEFASLAALQTQYPAADYPRNVAYVTGLGYARSDGTTWIGTSPLQLVGNVLVSETLIVGLSLGMKRMTLALAGVQTTDKLLAIPNGTPTTGCEVINAYPVSAGNVGIAYFTPILGIGATYNIPVAVYRVA